MRKFFFAVFCLFQSNLAFLLLSIIITWHVFNCLQVGNSLIQNKTKIFCLLSPYNFFVLWFCALYSQTRIILSYTLSISLFCFVFLFVTTMLFTIYYNYYKWTLNERCREHCIKNKFVCVSAQVFCVAMNLFWKISHAFQVN